MRKLTSSCATVTDHGTSSTSVAAPSPATTRSFSIIVRAAFAAGFHEIVHHAPSGALSYVAAPRPASLPSSPITTSVADTIARDGLNCSTCLSRSRCSTS